MCTNVRNNRVIDFALVAQRTYESKSIPEADVDRFLVSVGNKTGSGTTGLAHILAQCVINRHEG